ncbi:MAG: hypothetical protein MR606_03660 [Mollicutes bacterium]|nr:hypothetical protein [Mollicutes bacterium]MDD7263429.1 hypothetical protein [bacterium]MDY4980040.1 hypothetical protein [Candidatus Onthovivens sp.]
MKKNKILISVISLLTLTTLFSCGGGFEINIAVGDGNIENDDVYIKFNIDETLKEGSKIKGYLSAQKEAIIDSGYDFTYSYNSPFSDTYSDTVLFSRIKENLLDSKTSDGYKKTNFEITLNIKTMFKEDNDKIYFVLRKSNWDKGNIHSYNYTSYKYSAKNSKVTLTAF